MWVLGKFGGWEYGDWGLKGAWLDDLTPIAYIWFASASRAVQILRGKPHALVSRAMAQWKLPNRHAVNLHTWNPSDLSQPVKRINPMTIGTRRDNISRALRCLGYEQPSKWVGEYTLIKQETTIFIGRNGGAVIMGTNDSGIFTRRLNSATIAALISAGEYIFLCGSLSTNEKARIKNLVP